MVESLPTDDADVTGADPSTSDSLPQVDEKQNRNLLTGSVVLVIGAAVQAVGGSVFWLIAARIHAKSTVGSATALFTSVNFVTYLAGLGLPVALARYSVGRSTDADTTFSWAAAATVGAAAVSGVVYLLFLRVVVPPSTAALLHGGALWQATFAVSVIGAALSLIFDVRAMTLRRWHYVLIRITFVSVARMPLVLLIRPAHDPQLWLFVFAVAPLAVTGVAGTLWINHSSGGRLRFRPRPPFLGALVRYSAVNYLSTIGYQAPYFALPIIVLANVDADTNAAFYVAWGVVAVTSYVPSAIAQALLAEGGKDGVSLRTQLRSAMRLAVGIMAVGTVAAWFGSGLIETVYGHQYRDAATLLPQMMLAGVPWAITSLYLTEARVLHRHVANVAITTTLTLAIVVPALILVPGSGAGHGIVGAGHAWLFGNLVGLAVAVAAHRWGHRWGRFTGHEEYDPVMAGATT